MIRDMGESSQLPARKTEKSAEQPTKTHDLRCHVETHWKPLRNGGGEWIPSEALPDLRRILLNAEFIVKGRYEYRLAAEGKIIIRKPRTIF